jgi:hypothetical protein
LEWEQGNPVPEFAFMRSELLFEYYLNASLFWSFLLVISFEISFRNFLQKSLILEINWFLEISFRNPWHWILEIKWFLEIGFLKIDWFSTIGFQIS